MLPNNFIYLNPKAYGEIQTKYLTLIKADNKKAVKCATTLRLIGKVDMSANMHLNRMILIEHLLLTHNKSMEKFVLKSIVCHMAT